MKAVGVIVEYNPFHHGHAYHLQKAKEKANADIVIAAMSGNFLQRGEPALVSKWTRTEMALKGGVDLVFELPYAFAVQKADTFARGAVSLLSHANCESICFGSESGHIEPFYYTYHLLREKEQAYNKYTKKFIAEGHSYPKSMSLAFEKIQSTENLLDLSQPNNILGYQYVKAAEEQKKTIEMITIVRKNAHYHDKDFSSSTIASATSIRKALFSHHPSSIQAYVPSHTYELLLQYQQQFGSFHHWERYWSHLKFHLMQIDSKELAKIYEVEEGIENRILRLAIKSENFLQFMNQLKTKRYTWTRLQRILVHILTHTTKQAMQMNEEKVSYLRLLGMTEKGRKHLNRLKKECSIPIISKRSSFHHPQLEMDSKAAQIYAMGLPEKQRQQAIDLEYTQQPIYIQK